MNLLRRLWKNYIKKIDQVFLGPSIDRMVKERKASPECKALMWGLHKVLDSNYSPGDLTQEEKRILTKYFGEKKDYESIFGRET